MELELRKKPISSRLRLSADIIDHVPVQRRVHHQFERHIHHHSATTALVSAGFTQLKVEWGNIDLERSQRTFQYVVYSKLPLTWRRALYLEKHGGNHLTRQLVLFV